MIEVEGRNSETIDHAFRYPREENDIQKRTDLVLSKVMETKRSLWDYSTHSLAPCSMLFWGHRVATLLTDGEYSVQDRL